MLISVSYYGLTSDLFFIPVIREAINRLCDAVPGGKGAWRKKVNCKFIILLCMLHCFIIFASNLYRIYDTEQNNDCEKLVYVSQFSTNNFSRDGL